MTKLYYDIRTPGGFDAQWQKIVSDETRAEALDLLLSPYPRRRMVGYAFLLNLLEKDDKAGFSLYFNLAVKHWLGADQRHRDPCVRSGARALQELGREKLRQSIEPNS